MSPRALAPPIDDGRYWRRLVARAHPDAGGDHELFLFAQSCRDAICGGELGAEIPRRQDHRSRRREGSTDDADRVPFDSFASFEALTSRALAMAGAVAAPYVLLLRQLSDCVPLAHLAREQQRGATYKQLAAIGHMVGMSKSERTHWYRVAESVPLSQRHAGHILAQLKRRAA